MTTAYYIPAFLGPLGPVADELTAATLRRSGRTAGRVEIVVDTDPARPGLERLHVELTQGRVSRLVVRRVGDLCLTGPEFRTFIIAVIEHGVEVERMLRAPLGTLLAGRPRALGLYRHRQRVAKVLRLRRLGCGVDEICRLAHATRRQACRIMTANAVSDVPPPSDAPVIPFPRTSCEL